MSEKSSTEKVTVRRSPKFLTFFIFGAALAAIASILSSAVIISASPTEGGVPVFQIVGFFALFSSAIGGLLGLTVAVILDRVLRRSVRTAEATRTVTSTSSGANERKSS